MEEEREKKESGKSEYEMIMKKVLIILMIAIGQSSCTIQSPRFWMDGNCLKMKKWKTFGSIYIETSNPQKYYSISRNYEFDGVHEICLQDIPAGYSLIIIGDAKIGTAIKLEENQEFLIGHSGGDRASFEVNCSIRSKS